MPRRIRRDEAAERRTHHGRDESRPGNERDRVNQIVFFRRAQHDQPPDRHHHRAADALNHARPVNVTMPLLSPHRTEDTVKIAMAETKTVRAPTRSATHPLIGINTASISK